MPKALIVDDDADILEVARKAFEWAGYEVETAAAAGEALQKARAGGFQLVLMDLELPDRSGLTAAKELSAAAPLWLMSGHADAELERDARLLGARGLLAKPLEFGKLAERLKKELA